MRRRSSSTWLMVAVTATALVATACGGGTGDAGGKTTITFANWAAAETTTQAGIEALIEEFEKANPDIEVKSEPISFSDIAHQVLLETQAREAPDVIQTAGNDMLSLATAGALAPLDELAPKSYQDQIISTELDLGKVDGKLVAVPWAVTPFGLWYNKTVLTQAGLDPNSPPETMDDLLTQLAAVKQSAPGVIPLGLDTTNRSFGLDANWAFMQAFGAAPFDDDKANANSAQMKDYLEFMRTLADQKYTEINKKAGEFRPLAADNKVAFVWDGPYLKNTMQATNKMPDDQFFQTWGVIPLPAAKGGKSTSVPTDHQLSVSAQSENQEAAWKFVEFLSTSDSGMSYTVTTTGGLPPVTEPPASLADKLDNPIVAAYTDDVIPSVKRPPWGEGYGKAYSPIMAAVQSAMTSDTSLDDIAEQLQGQVETAVR
jgi:multiple sugar transport system substrate-binding protein